MGQGRTSCPHLQGFLVPGPQPRRPA